MDSFKLNKYNFSPKNELVILLDCEANTQVRGNFMCSNYSHHQRTNAYTIIGFSPTWKVGENQENEKW